MKIKTVIVVGKTDIGRIIQNLKEKIVIIQRNLEQEKEINSQNLHTPTIELKTLLAKLNVPGKTKKHSHRKNYKYHK